MKSSNKVLILLIILIIIIKIPIFPNLGHFDSYRILTMSNSIIEEGFSKWNLNMLSIAGLAPLSYPSALSYYLTSIRLTTGLDQDIIGIIYCTLISITAFFLMSSIVYRIYGKEIYAYLAAFFLVISPIFHFYTTWNLSSRAGLVVIELAILLLLMKCLEEKKLTYLITSILLIMISVFYHRMFLYLFIFLLPAYIMTILFFEKIKYSKKLKHLLFICILFIIIISLISQLIGIGPYSYMKAFYSTGFIFNPNINVQGLENLKILINIIVDYASDIGIISILFPIGLISYIFAYYRSKMSKRQFFLSIFLVLNSVLLINSYYTPLILLPAFIIISFDSFTKIISKLKNTYVGPLIFIMITGSIIFTLFMSVHWVNQHELKFGESYWLEDNVKTSVNFISGINSTIFIPEGVLNYKIQSEINKPLLPSNYEDFRLFQFDLLNHSDIKISLNPQLLFTTRKNIFDYEKSPQYNLITDGVDKIYRNDKVSNQLISIYNIDYALFRKYPGRIVSRQPIYRKIVSEENLIYANGNILIYRL